MDVNEFNGEDDGISTPFPAEKERAVFPDIRGGVGVGVGTSVISVGVGGISVGVGVGVRTGVSVGVGVLVGNSIVGVGVGISVKTNPLSQIGLLIRLPSLWFDVESSNTSPNPSLNFH